MKKQAVLALASMAAVLILTILVSGCVNNPFSKTIADTRSLKNGIRLGPGDRILFVAPHPDDETLATAGFIQIALKKKLPVKVVVMTSGDGYRHACQVDLGAANPGPSDFIALGKKRHLESVKAMSLVGMNRKDLIFLGYPDGGTDSLFGPDWDYNRLHLGLNGAVRSPYLFAYEKNAPYCGANVTKNLTSIISEFKPTIIVFPGPEDMHHDHWATNAFVEYTLTKMHYRAQLFTYLVHRGKTWPSPTNYAPQDALVPPAQLSDIGSRWLAVPLTKAQEARKYTAVSAYKSQLRLTEAYLEAFVRTNELYSVYPDIMVRPAPKDPVYFTDPALYGRVILDPRNDTYTNGLSGYGDLRGVAFSYDKDKAWFTVDTNKGINADVVYAFHLRIFKDDKSVSRIDAKVLDGTVSFPKYAKNSTGSKYTTRLRTKDSRLVLEMPANILKNAKYVMLNADTYTKNENKWLDRTGWRRLIVNP
jgi:N-acetyl-1-D-myo-inositol-2-amino-2-deoxy-alpha-D-glucopyranoside deacetylase